jgi:hypothetical protein
MSECCEYEVSVAQCCCVSVEEGCLRKEGTNMGSSDPGQKERNLGALFRFFVFLRQVLCFS